jgi:PAS domain S-box-containing protein
MKHEVVVGNSRKTAPGIMSALVITSGIYLVIELARSPQLNRGPTAWQLIAAVAQQAIFILLCIVIWKAFRRHGHQETSLRRDLDRVRSYIDAAAVMFTVIDAGQRVTLISTRGCEILKRESHEVVGRNWFDAFVPEQVREDLRTAFEEMISGRARPDEYSEEPVITRDGKEKLIAWHRALMRDENGEVVSVLNLGEDVTERKLTERLNAVLRELGMALSTVSNLRDGLRLCLEAALKASDMDCGGVYLVDET